MEKNTASLKEIQSLLGKLNFIAACVRPGRIFISRLLQWLKVLYHSDVKKHPIPVYVKKDIQWWNKFLPLYNRISMMMTEEFSQPGEIFSSDSCLNVCGGLGRKFLPRQVSRQNCRLEFSHKYNGNVICRPLCQIMGSFFKGKRIWIFCDNFPVCCVINSGRAHYTILQSCLKELPFVNAIYECEVRAVHLETKSNRLAVHLSRWHMSECYKQQFYLLTKAIS